jgi:hypothetical protein
MRPDLDRARRRRVVRDAALAWKRAGAIDASRLSAIESRYPEDRVRQGPLWRVLIFVFVYVIGSAVGGLAIVTIHPQRDAATVLALLFGAAFAAATELAQGRWRFDGTGAEAATSYLAVTSFVVAAALLLVDRPTSPAAALGATLAAAALLFGGAWWRWGFPVYALFAAACAFFAALDLPGPVRIFWIAGGVVAAAIASPLRESPRLSPPQRDGCGYVLGAALAAIYAAVNLFSLDHRFLEALRPGAAPVAVAWPLVRELSAGATALFPAALFAAGWRRKRRLLVDAGLVFSAVSLVTLRAYVHVGPLWLLLGASGAALILAASFFERFLARERSGWTAEALASEDAAGAFATTIAAATVLSPDARPSPENAGFTPGGGRYGGGGASGEF